MKKILFLLIIILITSNLFSMELTKNGKPNATVILGSDISDADRYASKEFISYVKKISGAELPTSQVPLNGTNNIYIGISQTAKDYVKSVRPNFKWESLKNDGVLALCKGNTLILAGPGSGSIYAVYSFFEEICNAVFISPDDEYIPKRKTIKCGDGFYTFVSPFMSRESFFTVNLGAWEYDLKLKQNGHNNPIPENLGGHYVLNGFAHTFNTLLNSEKYGKDHPEWYCMRSGARMASPLSQPCLSNKEMIRTLTENVLKTIEANPNDKIISVTQNDTQNFCECPLCAELTEKHGHSGALLTVINEVAKTVKEKHPDKYIETFAYQYTREAPKGGIVPLDNVIIRLCSIECDFSHPFDHPNNRTFYKDLKDWKKICKNLYIWDYVSNFADYLMIHPNIQVLQDNMQILAKNNVIAVFSEGDYTNRNSCLNHYKRYIIAKLLWNPDLDFVKESKKFLKAYYGPAANQMADFIYVTGKPFTEKENDKIFLKTFMHNNNYYTADDWIKGFSCLNKALAKAKNTKHIKRGKKKIAISKKDRQKYFDRVYADMLCYYAGYCAAPDSIKSEVEKSRLLPFRDYRTFIKTLNESGPSLGIINSAEGNTLDSGLYAAPSYAKTGPKPEICQNLKDEDWIDWQNKTLNDIYHNNQYCMSFDDPEASDGKAIWMCPKYDLRYIQKELSNIYLDETIKSGDFYAVYRINPNDKNSVCFYAGVADGGNNDIFRAEFKANETPEGKYITKKLGTLDFKQKRGNTYFWMSGSGDGNSTTGMYLDRVFIILHR